MYEFLIHSNAYLQQDIRAFYHMDFFGYKQPKNPDFINELKNDFGNTPKHVLQKACQSLENILVEDLPCFLPYYKGYSPTICLIPRAKAEDSYQAEQLLFKSTLQKVIKKIGHFEDGTDYLVRHTNTKTTHFRHAELHNNDGPRPYPGITKATCYLSSDIHQKAILLIDDVYTKTVNIVEDALQAIIEQEPMSLAFYAVARTVSKNHEHF